MSSNTEHIASGGYKEALVRVCNDFGLPVPDKYSQDWEYELAGEYRTKEWLQRYILACREGGYGVAEKRILVGVLLDSANDSLAADGTIDESIWSDIVEVIRSDYVVYTDLIDYWGHVGDRLDDSFAISPRVRALLDLQPD